MSPWRSEKFRNLNFPTWGKSILLTSLIVSGVVVGLRQLGALQSLELAAYDQMMRWRPDEGPDDRLLVVGVSESDIQTRREYPLQDGTLAQLLERLEAAQPRAIGVDILRDVPQGEGREALISQLENSDRIITVCQMSSVDEPGIAPAPGVAPEQVGFADLPIDPGGTLRRAILLSVPQESELPVPSQHLCNDPNPDNQLLSFGFNLALLYLIEEGFEPELLDNGNMQIGSTVFRRLTPNAGGYRRADTGSYQISLNYRSHRNAARQVTIGDVLEGNVDPSLIEDRIVLIGYTASIVKDDFYTPYSAGTDAWRMPGVVVHAQNISQILSAVLDNRPLVWYWPEGVEILWIFAWALFGSAIALFTRRLWVYGVSIVIAIAVLYGVVYLLFLGSGWVPLVPAAIALLGGTWTFFFCQTRQSHLPRGEENHHQH
ncbi:MAG: CHASE2 domain-containing protein [Desertifilum sp.]|nr:CHASE2 domain-containing protein [Desertifilum sp.]